MNYISIPLSSTVLFHVKHGDGGNHFGKSDSVQLALSPENI